MSATKTSTRPAELRADLQRLVTLAADVAIAEGRLETFARQLGERDGDVFEDLMREAGFDGNLHHVALDAVRGAVRDATNEHGNSDFYGIEKAQSAQDALDVFEFVARRLDLDGEWIEAESS